MQPDEIRHEYQKRAALFDRAGRTVRDALASLLDAAGIAYLTVEYRVKSLDSLLEKTAQKQYSNPFEENTDFVGLRIIVYYIDDVTNVVGLVSREFDVLESDDKAENLGVQEFGYRSHHCIARIHQSWLAAPNFRGLGDCKVEIQIRTVLTHAWAEIEHKLRYKSKQQVPRNLQRRLFLLSAKFEEADQQFKELRDQSFAYRSTLSKELQTARDFNTSLEMNLDTFEAFLKFSYPKYKESKGVSRHAFEYVEKNGLTFKDLVALVDDFRPYEPRLEQEYGDELTSANALSYAFDVLGKLKKPISPSAGRKRMIEALKDFGKTIIR